MRGTFPRNVPRNCIQGLRRVGWPRLTCDQGWNKAASTQVKAKREDLSRRFYSPILLFELYAPNMQL
jgi:hypothetical protein